MQTTPHCQISRKRRTVNSFRIDLICESKNFLNNLMEKKYKIYFYYCPENRQYICDPYEIRVFEGSIQRPGKVTSCKKETLKTNISATQRSTTTYRIQLPYQDLRKHFLLKKPSEFVDK